MSAERQRYLLEQQRREVLDGIAELKANHGERFSIKQMERTKKSIDAKLEKLNDQSRKDDVVTFEELGIDRIFIDEAHYYKKPRRLFPKCGMWRHQPDGGPESPATSI